MTKIGTIVLALALMSISVTVCSAVDPDDELTFDGRRQYLAEMLSAPGLFPVRHNHFTKELQSREWHHAVMEFSINQHSLRLDARDLERPLRIEAAN